MNKTQQIAALEARLDNLILNFDQQQDLYLQSHLGRYLIILTAGYVEQVVQNSLTQFSRTRAAPEVVNYVDETISWEGSINRSKLERILNRFDKAWYPALENQASDAEKNAIDSIKQLRDQLAHGNENGTGYGAAKNYHFLVRSYLARMLTIVP